MLFDTKMYVIAALTVLLCAIGTCAFAQDLTVQVRDTENKALPYANIWINGKLQGVTDLSGSLVFPRPTTNGIQIRVSHSGYPDRLQQVKLDTVVSAIQLAMDDQRKLDEVVVTAGRKPESMANIPSSVAILTTKEIEAQSQISTDIASVLGNTIPGLGVAARKGTNSGQTLRGRAVLVLIDGIPQSTPLMNGARDIRSIDPSVIERVEVIKGATSIYGNGSAGGIINYITRKNDAQATKVGGITTLRGTLNPYHNKETEGYRFSQTLYGRQDKFSYTASGTVDYTGLQRDGDGVPLGQTDGLSNSRSYNAFVKLGYDIDASSSLSFVYNFFNSLQHARYVSQNGKYGESPTIGILGVDPGKSTGTRFNHNAMLTFAKNQLFGETSLNAAMYYNTFSSMNRYVEESNSWYGPGQTQINSNKKGLRVDLHTPFEIGTVMGGVTYGIDLLNDITFQDLTDGRVFVPKMDMFNYAPFAQLTLTFVDHVIFKGGLRYEDATVNIKDFETLPTGPGNVGSVAVEGGTIPYRGVTFNAGLRYNKYQFLNPFVSFSQGFTINELGRIVRNATESDLKNIQTDPIVTNNYELGFASQIGMVNVSVAYFISTSKLGVNLTAREENGYFFPERAPERVSGVELALDVRLSSNLTLGGTYSYVEGKLKRDDGTESYLGGSRIMPPKATGYVHYSPTSALDFQVSWVHTGNRDRFERTANAVYLGNQGPVKPVDILNFNGGYKINRQWSVGVGLANLFNKDYYSVYSQFSATDPNYVKGEGATMSLNLNYRF
ncbi:TonB-dependent receptor [Sphingobacterium paludis]|uniref:Iron complex outermembrane receptor protein n=1 Tax=Sphingobacterium paludis TaxID=1476465 RepID=A0A4R7CVJ1_9SPHI|nr:TonB-dependent receptor [Sphingobacterium paludis]TDS11671.1 iron complex outermembrane receptor protein [Sphingobacterium paludis]